MHDSIAKALKIDNDLQVAPATLDEPEHGTDKVSDEIRRHHRSGRVAHVGRLIVDASSNALQGWVLSRCIRRHTRNLQTASWAQAVRDLA